MYPLRSAIAFTMGLALENVRCVHLEASGCPIVGDSLYGAGWQPEVAERAERLQLHALRLRFHLGGEPLELEAPPPPDFGLNP